MSNVKEITTNIVENTSTQRTIFNVLVSGIIVLSVVYVYLIGSITFNVLARKTLETTERDLGNRISALELSYLNTANKVDKSFAFSKGFVDASDTVFAQRALPRVAIR